MLMAAQLPLPEKVFGHGFLTKDNQKMGKSLGNTLDPVDLVERYGPDAVRYYFLTQIELGKDGDFNETRFINVLNADLANDLGNLLNRTLGMVKKYCQGQGPQLTAADLSPDNALLLLGQNLGDRVVETYDKLALSEGGEAIFTLIRACNKYIDETAPWSLYKQQQQQEVEKILYSVLESIRLAAYLLSPIIPNLSTDIYHQLGFTINFNDWAKFKETVPFEEHGQWGSFPANVQLNAAKPIFNRLEFPTSQGSS